MVRPDVRREIIEQIHDGRMVEKVPKGRQAKWWTTTHEPNEEIPRNIYLLGDGYVDDLEERYARTYGTRLTHREFWNYTREMIQQGIIVLV